MTPDDIRRTAGYRAMLACLIRHIQARREAVLDRIGGQGRRWDLALSNELDQVDAALTEIGVYDTK
jgi:hypothetical protein